MVRNTLTIALAAMATLAAAALGFAVAHTHTSGHATLASSSHPTAGLLQVSVPSGWSRRPAPAGLPLTLSDELAVSPSRTSSNVLVIGRTQAARPQLLPQSLIASLGSLPAGSTVNLGRTQFSRYSNLSLRGTPWSASVYATPTTEGAVLGVCLSHGVSASFASGCEDSLKTLRLPVGSALPLGAIPAYAAGLNMTMQNLNAARAQLSASLRAARSAKGQARAAYALGRAQIVAATALVRLNAGPAEATNLGVADALRLDGAAYRALGRAASRQQLRAYNQARVAVRRATEAWQAAYSRLGAYGYSIG